MSRPFVHKIIIAGCRCVAGPLPSGPHSRGPHVDPGPPDQATGAAWRLRPRCRACQHDAGAGGSPCGRVVLSRHRSATSAERVPSISATVAPTTTVEPRVEVVERLREILRLRDKALTRRDASLLDGIYTVDCNCLENTRRLIRAMREDRVVWRGLSTSLSVQNVEKASDRLWHITGVLTTSMVRIEEESGGLIRVAPAEHDRFRFAVVRPRSSQDWLLGYAAILG
jgi:hypothetical protein